LSIIEATVEALCAEREREKEINVDSFRVMFSAFSFSLGDGDICIKNKKYQYSK
jgi:hypothetical protein